MNDYAEMNDTDCYACCVSRCGNHSGRKDGGLDDGLGVHGNVHLQI